MRRPLGQCLVGHLADRAHAAVGRNSLIEIDLTEQRLLLVFIAAHTTYISHLPSKCTILNSWIFQQPVKPCRDSERVPLALQDQEKCVNNCAAEKYNNWLQLSNSIDFKRNS